MRSLVRLVAAWDEMADIEEQLTEFHRTTDPMVSEYTKGAARWLRQCAKELRARLPKGKP